MRRHFRHFLYLRALLFWSRNQMIQDTSQEPLDWILQPSGDLMVGCLRELLPWTSYLEVVAWQHNSPGSMS